MEPSIERLTADNMDLLVKYLEKLNSESPVERFYQEQKEEDEYGKNMKEESSTNAESTDVKSVELASQASALRERSTERCSADNVDLLIKYLENVILESPVERFYEEQVKKDERGKNEEEEDECGKNEEEEEETFESQLATVNEILTGSGKAAALVAEVAGIVLKTVISSAKRALIQAATTMKKEILLEPFLTDGGATDTESSEQDPKTSMELERSNEPPSATETQEMPAACRTDQMSQVHFDQKQVQALLKKTELEIWHRMASLIQVVDRMDPASILKHFAIKQEWLQILRKLYWLNVTFSLIRRARYILNYNEISWNEELSESFSKMMSHVADIWEYSDGLSKSDLSESAVIAGNNFITLCVQRGSPKMQAHSQTQLLGTVDGVPFLIKYCEANFKEIKKLGSGAFGTVYEVEVRNRDQDEHQESTKYALKKIMKEMYEHVHRDINDLARAIDDTAQAKKEALLLAELSHQHVVQYKFAWVEIGCNDQSRKAASTDSYQSHTASDNDVPGKEKDLLVLHIQMELCCRNLAEWLEARNRSLKECVKPDESIVRQALEIFRQIMEGMKYVHSKGFAHQDIKNQNILFGRDGAAKIGDFGFPTAGSKFPSKRSEEGSEGSAALSSPDDFNTREEYLQDKQKVDIYDLGMVLIDLLVPFHTEKKRREEIKNIDNRRVPIWLKAYPKDVTDLLSAMRSEDASKRPSAEEILDKPLFSKMKEPTDQEHIRGSLAPAAALSIGGKGMQMEKKDEYSAVRTGAIPKTRRTLFSFFRKDR